MMGRVKYIKTFQKIILKPNDTKFGGFEFVMYISAIKLFVLFNYIGNIITCHTP